MRVLVTRPIEASQSLARKLRDLGIDVDMAPMLEIALLTGEVRLEGASALVYTSRNAVKAFVASGQKFNGPVFAVGEATAAALRADGCKTVIAAGGNVESLAACIKNHRDLVRGTILHLSGESRRGDLVEELARAGLNAARQIVYSASPSTGIEPEIQERIRRRDYDAVLFFSPRSARTFVSLLLAKDLGSHMGTCSAIALSEGVAGEVRAVTWRQILVADKASEAAMIASLQPQEDQKQAKGS